MLHSSLKIGRAVGHFSLITLSAYTKLGTFIGWF
jgi:hypothetical protein